MGKRGRPSADDLAARALPWERPEPPEDLSEAQAAEWRAVVDRMPPDWFPRETHGLLSAYCNHAVSHRAISLRVRRWEQKPTDRSLGLYKDLLKLRDREARAMTTLATKMRLTQQSRYDAKTASTAAKNGGDGEKPWEYGG